MQSEKRLHIHCVKGRLRIFHLKHRRASCCIYDEEIKKEGGGGGKECLNILFCIITELLSVGANPGAMGVVSQWIE